MSLNARENRASHRYDTVLDAGLVTRVTRPFLVSWVERHPEYAGRGVLG